MIIQVLDKPRVGQTYLEEKTKANIEIITQTVGGVRLSITLYKKIQKILSSYWRTSEELISGDLIID